MERKQIISFLEETSVNEFWTEKAAGHLRDILEGARNTRPSNRELDISIPEEMDRQIKEIFAKLTRTGL